MSEHEPRPKRPSGQATPSDEEQPRSRPPREITPLERIAKLRATWGED